MPLLNSDRLFGKQNSYEFSSSLYQSILNCQLYHLMGIVILAGFQKIKGFQIQRNFLYFLSHYILRMLVSNGLTLNELGLSPFDDSKFEKDPRKIWRNLVRTTICFEVPQLLWLDYSFEKSF